MEMSQINLLTNHRWRTVQTSSSIMEVNELFRFLLKLVGLLSKKSGHFTIENNKSSIYYHLN